MRIGIYAPYLNTYGGGEKYICKIAETLGEENSVEFIVTNEPDVKGLENRLNVDLSRIAINHVRIPEPFGGVPYLRGLTRIRTIAKVTGRYDLFINQEHFSLVPSLAKRSFLICEVPVLRLGKLAWLPKKLLSSFIFDSKLKTYDGIVVNSFYTKRWVQRNYEKQIEVLYPPIDTQQFLPLPKRNVILSVGRFFVGGHCKKQLEMIRAFKRTYTDGESLKGWEYHLIGGLGTNAKDRAYLTRCQDEARGYPICLRINAPFQILKELYGEGRIFLHATGLYEDEHKYPERAEHFGITTGEAMSAGCVPVVINKGGQPEIVRHNIDGFLWDSIEQLKESVVRLATNERLWQRMSESSIKRSQEFSVERFKEEVKRILVC